MRKQSQLPPPRPGRRELFHIAERFLDETSDARQPDADDHLAQLASSHMMAPLMIGFVLERPISRLVTARRRQRLREQDEALLAAELHCRDIEPFGTLAQLAIHIVTHERPRRD